MGTHRSHDLLCYTKLGARSSLVAEKLKGHDDGVDGAIAKAGKWRRPRRENERAEAAFISACKKGMQVNRHVMIALSRCLGRARAHELARLMGIVIDDSG